jgi:integrase
MGLSEARKRARAMLVEIEAGADPVAGREAAEAERIARQGLPTVTERLAQWQAAKADRWSPTYAADVARFCAKEIAPRLGKRQLEDTSRADWTSLVADKRKQSQSSAGNLYRIASAFLGFAEAHGWVDRPPAATQGRERPGTACEAARTGADDQELRSVWFGADSLPAKARAFVRLLAMSAARRTEVADIATGEIDLKAGLWSVPSQRAKNRRAITLPLHPLLLAELRAVWPAHGDRVGPGWKLLGSISGSGLRGYSKFKLRLDAASGVSDWGWHDLRRSARTGMARLGVPDQHAEAALNHISNRSALVRTYDRHGYTEEVIAALSRWQNHVASLIAEPSDVVVPLRQVRR